MEPKVGLALGSGGLRGLAHVGVLRILEQERIPVSYLAGCSIGSLVGALYSSGQTYCFSCGKVEKGNDVSKRKYKKKSFNDQDRRYNF